MIGSNLQDKGTFPSQPGHTGLKLYVKQHPSLILGGICGVLATVFNAL